MPEENDSSNLISSSDRAIYEYLDEMLSDPVAGSGSDSFKIQEESLPSKAVATSGASPGTVSAKTSPGTLKSQSKEKPKESASVLKYKEKPELKVLTSSPTLKADPQTKTQTQTKEVERKASQEKETLPRETMLGFEKPIVVQQPPIKENVTEAKQVALEPKAANKAAEVKAKLKALHKSPEKIPEQPTVQGDTDQPIEAKAPSAPLPKEKVEPAPVVEQEKVIDPDSVMGVVEDKAGRLPPAETWHESGRPDWAQGRFECLLFKVAGLKLAVPLVTLGAIHQIDRKFNALPGQLDWFIGILQTNVGNIKVMDTALCVMPEKYEKASREGLKYVLTLHGFEWGISCHEILKSVTLEADDVKWRTQRGKRPWLAGTVVDQMCALVDTAGFHHVISEAEKKKT